MEAPSFHQNISALRFVNFRQIIVEANERKFYLFSTITLTPYIHIYIIRNLYLRYIDE